jgi:hypothetical protein
MVQLLAGVKKLYESDLTIKEIGEQSLQDCMGISYADSHLLYVLLKLINNHPFREMPFRLAGWGDDACDPQWKLALTDDVINLFRTDDLSAFLDALLSTSYDPTVPWSREEREKRLTANLATGMSQLWDKPHQTTPQTTATLRPTGYISEARLNALRAIKSKAFDCTRLISMCEELDDCAKNGNVHATIFLTRAILDHIPPVFNFKTFTEVASNYGGGISFRRVTERLEKHTREIANIRLHTPIRDKETVPHFEEVNFASELESVLAELCRLLKREA